MVDFGHASISSEPHFLIGKVGMIVVAVLVVEVNKRIYVKQKILSIVSTGITNYLGEKEEDILSLVCITGDARQVVIIMSSLRSL